MRLAPGVAYANKICRNGLKITSKEKREMATERSEKAIYPDWLNELRSIAFRIVAAQRDGDEEGSALRRPNLPPFGIAMLFRLFKKKQTHWEFRWAPT